MIIQSDCPEEMADLACRKVVERPKSCDAVEIL